MTAPTAPATPSTPSAPADPRVSTRRNTELALILVAMVIVLAYSAAVEYALVGRVTARFWVIPALLTLLFVGAHIAVRNLTPYADPSILPCVALLDGLGVAFLRRLDLGGLDAAQRAGYGVLAGLGFRQLLWTLVSIVVATIALIIVRDHRILSRYAYTLGLIGLVLMMIPAVLPASLSSINGAKLWIKFGGFFQIQPGEFAKLLLLSFFAYYLVSKREVLSLASRRFLGIDFPRGRDMGPVIVVWVLSLMVLVFEKDLGTALLYFGMFVVTLYIATERVSWLIIGLVLFIGGAFLANVLGATIGGPFANFHERVEIWLNPFADPNVTGYQLVQSLLGLGTGGLFGAGPGAGQPENVPFVNNDFIFAGIGEEIGLFGLTGLLLIYLLITVRGLRAAIAVRDSFGKLMAGGLAFTLGLQVFVIVGGVTKLIPLTGQTTPFLSAGGSSLMANWLLIGLLLRISDASRRPATSGASPSGQPERLAGLATEVIR
ncbi:FtsW/RodA/SpoVE family cell cycle protein [Rugosimonospora acidiphila]|uniref:FtsW/RodA/SpoVE family cell cycle protein n=1 Tax=Rugosimonospora acidiphila TaxID=556531 RepID=A0ABP9RGN9_9ACTN